MSTELLQRVRSEPNSLELRRVLADALLEAPDPRGELIVAQLAQNSARAAAALPDVAKVLRRRAPGFTKAVFRGGLLHRLEMPLGRVSRLSPALFEAEPLTRVVLTTEANVPVGRVADAVESFRHRALARGLELPSGLSAEELDRIVGLLRERTPPYLWLRAAALEPGDFTARAPPGLRGLALFAPKQGVIFAMHQLGWFRSLERLSLRQAMHPEELLPALDVSPALQELDLRGVPLSPEVHAALAASGRKVRHESFSLDSPGLDDPFAEGGLEWPLPEESTRRVAAVRGMPGAFALLEGQTLKLYRNDAPAWRVPLPKRGVRVNADAGGVSVELDDFTAQLHALEDGAVKSASAPFPPSETAGGSAVIVAGKTHELGEPVLARAHDGQKTWVLGEEHVFTFDGRAWRVVGPRSGGPPVLSVAGGWAAYFDSPQSVVMRSTDLERVANATWPSTYSGVPGRLQPADLSVGDDGTVVVTFENGGTNLLMPGAGRALKADEFKGEPRRRWIFIFGGQILVAN